MDGKEQLRRYLEQRREAGERDLLLDDMTVEEVLRIVGARTGAARSVGEPTPHAGTAAPDADAGDWRAVLAAARGTPTRRDVGATGPIDVPPEPPRRAPGAPPASPAVTSTAAPETGPATPVEPTTRGSTSEARWPAGLAVGQPHSELFGGPLSSVSTLDELAAVIAACTQCPLYGTATHPVPGEGSAAASLVCVGEAPGATEDATGRPFVGQAGKLLDKILGAIQLQREDVFICNVLKHRPPGNRNPLPDEVVACSPYLVRQLELIRPKVIIAFGTFAAQTLLQTKDSIGKLRSAVHRYYGVPLIVTYHPAALLRNPAWKRPTWEDVQYARRILDGTGV